MYPVNVQVCDLDVIWICDLGFGSREKSGWIDKWMGENVIGLVGRSKSPSIH